VTPARAASDASRGQVDVAPAATEPGAGRPARRVPAWVARPDRRITTVGRYWPGTCPRPRRQSGPRPRRRGRAGGTGGARATAPAPCRPFESTGSRRHGQPRAAAAGDGRPANRAHVGVAVLDGRDRRRITVYLQWRSPEQAEAFLASPLRDDLECRTAAHASGGEFHLYAVPYVHNSRQGSVTDLSESSEWSCGSSSGSDAPPKRCATARQTSTSTVSCSPAVRLPPNRSSRRERGTFVVFEVPHRGVASAPCISSSWAAAGWARPWPVPSNGSAMR
jgi:hypothetical protein